MDLLLIRADASPEIGTGHVMRCLALAEQWGYCGGQVILASALLPASLAERAGKVGATVCRLSATPGSDDDARETARLAQDQQAAWVMADGYHFDAQFQRKVKAAGNRVLWVDDFGHAGEYCADLVLNQNLGAVPALYPGITSSTQLLLSSPFVLLRRDFLKWQNWPRPIPERARRILVTLGGSDRDKVTLKVIEALGLLGGLDLGATVVIGGSNPHGPAIAAALRDTPHQVRQDAANMPELMAEADLAVAAGGTTAWELAFMGLPALMFILAENQTSNCEQLAARGAVVNLGWENRISVSEIAQALARLANNRQARQEMSQRGRALVDGHGSFRVWLHTHEHLLQLRPVTAADTRLIWEWANAPDVRAVSFSAGTIAWEDHVKWFQARLTNPHCRFWLATDARQQPLGQVRFDLQGPRAVISISLAAAARGKNRGSLLIWTACQKLFRELQAVETVLAYIKPDNDASIRAFQKAGFEMAAKTEVKGQTASLFELKKPV
jgi:UDP-2,4-diacetamido-2,4,6-trideoxy-beta-L-altropyranose hydrolase